MATSRAAASTPWPTRVNTCDGTSPASTCDGASPLIELQAARLDDPDALLLVEEVQAEYQRRYGGPGDVAPIDATQFVAPDGHFLLALVDGQVAGMGGWRRGGPQPGDIEIKRMFVRPAFGRRGVARVILAAIERTAAEAGGQRLVLETGTAQPEAIELYTSSGYTPIEAFGFYAGYDDSVHLAKALAPVGPAR